MTASSRYSSDSTPTTVHCLKSTLSIGLPTRLRLGCVEEGGDWALSCLLYNQPFTFYVGPVAAAAFTLPLWNTYFRIRIQAVSNSCLPRLQAQSFIFLLHCICICQRRLSDLSSVLVDFRSVRICISHVSQISP